MLVNDFWSDIFLLQLKISVVRYLVILRCVALLFNEYACARKMREI